MTFLRPTLSQIIERTRSDFETRLPGADSRLRHSVLDVIARVLGGASSNLHGFLDHIANQRMPDSMEAEYLTRWSTIWGVRRKAATPAEAIVTVTGTNDIEIPAGSQLQRVDGTGFVTTADATIAAGTATVPIEAAEAGKTSALETGVRLVFASPIAGVNANAIVAELTNEGTDDEDDDSLRARLLDRIQQPPQGGTRNDYVQWALAIPGVSRAWCYPDWMGLGTVGLSFVMDAREDIIPTEDDIADVSAVIDVLRPVTAELYVFAPTTQEVPFLIRVTPDNAAVREAIAAELADFFARESVPGATLNRSRMVEAISKAAGEHHHELQVPGDDVGSAPAELLVLGEVMFE